jgi:cell division inhibitor SepF
VAVTELFEKVGNFIANTFGGEDDPFESYVDDETGEYGDYIEEGSALREPEYSPMSFMEKRKSKVVQLPVSNRGGSEVVLVEPRSFDDAAAIVHHLKESKIVMLNLHLLDNSQSQRTIDFVCGAASALNGQPQKVGDMVFVFTPNNVTLTVDAAKTQTNLGESLWGGRTL